MNIKENNETIVLVDSKGEGHLVSKQNRNDEVTSRQWGNSKMNDLKNQSFVLNDEDENNGSGFYDDRKDATADTIVNKPFTETYEKEFFRK